MSGIIAYLEGFDEVSKNFIVHPARRWLILPHVLVDFPPMPFESFRLFGTWIPSSVVKTESGARSCGDS